MKLTDPERLILTMLSEIHAALEIEDGIDPAFVQEAIQSRNEWGLSWRYSGLLQERAEAPTIVKEVGDILDMWERLELGYADLSPAEKTRVIEDAAPFGDNPKFYGFDGNHEGDYSSVASFMVDQLGHYPYFRGRVGLDAHWPTIDTYRRMLAVFEPMREPLMNGNLGADQIIALLKERTHPSRR